MKPPPPLPVDTASAVVRRERVAEIAAEIREGRYSIDPWLVAGAILAGTGPPKGPSRSDDGQSA